MKITNHLHMLFCRCFARKIGTSMLYLSCLLFNSLYNHLSLLVSIRFLCGVFGRKARPSLITDLKNSMEQICSKEHLHNIQETLQSF